ANYCGYGHYWQAPLCAGYMLPGSPYDPAMRMGGAGSGTAGAGAAGATATGTAGTTSAPASGSAGSSATMTPAAGASGAPASGPGTTAPAPAAAKKSGCSAAALSSDSRANVFFTLALGLSLVVATRRTRRARRNGPLTSN